jgi:hypothetical protein
MFIRGLHTAIGKEVTGHMFVTSEESPLPFYIFSWNAQVMAQNAKHSIFTASYATPQEMIAVTCLKL